MAPTPQPGKRRVAPVQRAWLHVQRLQLLGLSALARRLHGRGTASAHLQVGERGELEAIFFLRGLGYFVVERRWHCPEWNGDLDLIAYDGDVLCFIEVKTRTARDLTPAAAAIDDRKRTYLRRLARAYLRTLPDREHDAPPVRFDVVSVYLLPRKVECELLQAAFPLAEDRAGDRFSRYGV